MPPRRTPTRTTAAQRREAQEQTRARVAQRRAERIEEFNEVFPEVGRMLAAYDGTNDFLLRMRRQFEATQFLTVAQANTVRSAFAEMAMAAARTRRQLERMQELQANEGTIARVDDLPRVLNGTYTLDDGVQHLTFDIRTMNRSRNEHMRNARVIRVQRQYEQYVAFGFLTTDGRVQVWQSAQSRVTPIEKRWAQQLLNLLSDEDASAQMRNELVDAYRDGEDNPRLTVTVVGEGSEDDPEWTISVSCRCSACNRALTDPTSIRLGIGPECNRQAQERATTRARGERTPLFVDDDMPDARFRDDDEEDEYEEDEPRRRVGNPVQVQLYNDEEEYEDEAMEEIVRDTRGQILTGARRQRELSRRRLAEQRERRQLARAEEARRAMNTPATPLMSELTPTLVR